MKNIHPKKTKYTRIFKNRKFNKLKVNSNVFGILGFIAINKGYISYIHFFLLNLFFKKISKKIKHSDRLIWLKSYPHLPITKKPQGLRMGKGKGKRFGWISIVNRGTIFIECKNFRLGRYLYFFRQINKKLPFALKKYQHFDKSFNTYYYTKYIDIFNNILLSTINQSLLLKKISKKPFSRTNKLKKNPQKRGSITKLYIKTPKKPNSALRQVAKVILSTKKYLITRLPGWRLFPKRFNKILIRGGRANDLPGVNASAVRGTWDFSPLIGIRYKRSKYGVKRAANSLKHIRRCYRKFYI